jgi:hypothetical protein
MKSERQNELFDVFAEAPVNNFIDVQLDEKYKIEDITINYPKFENLEKIRIPQYKEQIKIFENYIQPQTNQYLNDVNNLFS